MDIHRLDDYGQHGQVKMCTVYTLCRICIESDTFKQLNNLKTGQTGTSDFLDSPDCPF